MPHVKSADYQEMQDQIKEYHTLLEKVNSGEADELADPYVDLKNDIENDKVVVKANEIDSILFRDLVIELESRERLISLDTNKQVRVKPYRLTDQVYNVVSRSILLRILREIGAPSEHEENATGFDSEDLARRFVAQCASLGVNSVGRAFSWTDDEAYAIAIVADNETGDLGVEFIDMDTNTITQVADLQNALIIIS